MMILRQILIVTYFYLVSGQNGRCDGPLVCCRGFEYNAKEDICHPCKEPKFGAGCTKTCNCTEEEICDRFTGCVARTTTTAIAPESTKTVKDTSHPIINQSMMIFDTYRTHHPKIPSPEVFKRKELHMPFPYWDEPLLFSIICLSFVVGVVFSLYIATCIVEKVTIRATVEIREMRRVRYEVGNGGNIYELDNTNHQ